MSFKLSQVKGPSRSRVVVDKDASQAIVELTVLAKAANGLVEPATSSTARSEVVGVSTESIGSADALTQVGVNQIFENDTYIADTANDSNSTHTGQRMLLSNAGVVNNTGTDNANGVVEQVGVVGLPAERKIIVKFV